MFSIPEFPIVCAIWTGPWIGKGLHRLVSPCNLGQGRRGMPWIDFEPIAATNYSNTSQLLLPALTDIRDGSHGGPVDIVEVPSGSSRWYRVVAVDDLGKGFDNEHRFALIRKIYEGLDPTLYPGANWPIPIP